jgi:gamma-glutamyltranspeptidase/glutathione hydrolase
MPLNLNSIYPATDPEFQPFPSRRSVIHSTEGIIACTQPLAARCGLKVLDAGGNAAVSDFTPLSGLGADRKMKDAAVAVGMYPIRINSRF